MIVRHRPRNAPSWLRKLVLAGVIAVCSAVAVASPAAATPGVPEGIVTSRWGSPGSLVAFQTPNWCTQFGAYRNIDAATFEVRNSPGYANRWQTVVIHTGVQWRNANGTYQTYWHPHVASYALQPGNTSVRGEPVRSFTVNPGTYLVVKAYTWYVGSQMVGQAHYVFDGDTYVANGDARRGPSGDAAITCTFV